MNGAMVGDMDRSSTGHNASRTNESLFADVFGGEEDNEQIVEMLRCDTLKEELKKERERTSEAEERISELEQILFSRGREGETIRKERDALKEELRVKETRWEESKAREARWEEASEREAYWVRAHENVESELAACRDELRAERTSLQRRTALYHVLCSARNRRVRRVMSRSWQKWVSASASFRRSRAEEIRRRTALYHVVSMARWRQRYLVLSRAWRTWTSILISTRHPTGEEIRRRTVLYHVVSMTRSRAARLVISRAWRKWTSLSPKSTTAASTKETIRTFADDESEMSNEDRRQIVKATTVQSLVRVNERELVRMTRSTNDKNEDNDDHDVRSEVEHVETSPVPHLSTPIEVSRPSRPADEKIESLKCLIANVENLAPKNSPVTARTPKRETSVQESLLAAKTNTTSIDNILTSSMSVLSRARKMAATSAYGNAQSRRLRHARAIVQESATSTTTSRHESVKMRHERRRRADNLLQDVRRIESRAVHIRNDAIKRGVSPEDIDSVLAGASFVLSKVRRRLHAEDTDLDMASKMLQEAEARVFAAKEAVCLHSAREYLSMLLRSADKLEKDVDTSASSSAEHLCMLSSLRHDIEETREKVRVLPLDEIRPLLDTARDALCVATQKIRTGVV